MAEPSLQNHLEPITDATIASIPSNVAELFVVRHGETEYNATGVIQGHLDIKLNEAGRKQARALATRVSEDCKFTAIYSSDLKRAFETAEIIAEKFEIKVIREPMLRERNLGDLQGVEYSEAPTVCPEAFEALTSSKLMLKFQVEVRALKNYTNVVYQHLEILLANTWENKCLWLPMEEF